MKFRRRHLSLTLKQHILVNASLLSSKEKSLSDALTEFGKALGLMATVQLPETYGYSLDEYEPKTKPKKVLSKTSTNKRPSPQSVDPPLMRIPSTPQSLTIPSYEEDIIDAEAALRQRCIDERAYKLGRRMEQRESDSVAMRIREAEKPAPKQKKMICKFYMEGSCSKVPRHPVG